MNNPFEEIEKQLNDIKLILVEALKQKSPTPPDNLPEEIGGIELAQKITGLAKPTIYGLVSLSKIPCMKKGKKLYFSKSELIDWLKEGKKKTVQELQNEIRTKSTSGKTFKNPKS